MKLQALVVLAAGAVLTGCATSPEGTLPQADFSRFHAVAVGPVRFTPEVAGALPDDERTSLECDFGAALKEGLSSSLEAGEASAGVLRVEVTITELNASNPTVNFLTTALLFVPVDAGGIAFVARFHDGESPEPFAQSTYHHLSTPLELKGSFKRYGHATRSLHDWAEALTRRIGGSLHRQVARND